MSIYDFAAGLSYERQACLFYVCKRAHTFIIPSHRKHSYLSYIMCRHMHERHRMTALICLSRHTENAKPIHEKHRTGTRKPPNHHSKNEKPALKKHQNTARETQNQYTKNTEQTHKMHKTDTRKSLSHRPKATKKNNI